MISYQILLPRLLKLFGPFLQLFVEERWVGKGFFPCAHSFKRPFDDHGQVTRPCRSPCTTWSWLSLTCQSTILLWNSLMMHTPSGRYSVVDACFFQLLFLLQSIFKIAITLLEPGARFRDWTLWRSTKTRWPFSMPSIGNYTLPMPSSSAGPTLFSNILQHNLLRLVLLAHAWLNNRQIGSQLFLG